MQILWVVFDILSLNAFDQTNFEISTVLLRFNPLNDPLFGDFCIHCENIL